MHTLHYFVHIPKTAGVTVRTWLRKVFARDEVIFVYDGKLREDPHALAFSREELLRRAGELPASLRVLFGHYMFEPESLLHDRCRAISLVRDARARVLSWRRYVLANGAALPDPMLQDLAARFAEGMGLAEACARHGGIRELDNGITRMLGSRRGPVGAVDESALEQAMRNVERHFDYVGNIDWFDASMQRIAEVLGRPFATVESQNVSRGGRSQADDAAELSDRDAEWLAARTQFDERLVRWLAERFRPY
ncbi:MAG TPA: hypothetical protein ENI87_09945 [bacterium]|nr:hypothetical protein [bacterium]